MIRVSFIFLMGLITLNCAGQPMGTIRVNEHYSATCDFSSPIKNIYIANNELIETIRTSQGTEQRSLRQYDYVIDGNTVVFSTYKELPAKSVTVKLTDESTWYGIIQYDPKNKEIYYCFRDTKKDQEKTAEKEDSLDIIKTRLNQCLNKKTHFRPLGITKNRIYWEVANIITDKEITYIKIIVSNQSGHVYKISNGSALFEYKEGKSRNLKKKEASIKVDGIIIHQTGKSKIEAYTSEILGYAVKSYPLNSTGKLHISFIEADGKRNYEIKVPFKYLEKVETFND